MNTRGLMTVSAIVMVAGGIGLSFLPQEILGLSGFEKNPVLTVIIQLLGALYFGFGIANWTARGSLMGGIYGRAVCIGNFSHFLIGALALAKGYFSSGSTLLLLLILIYAPFAILFSIAFFTHPLPVGSD